MIKHIDCFFGIGSPWSFLAVAFLYLRAEHGDAIDLMAVIKNAIDPAGIMNPGKVFPS